jgi:murein DD-endopeptidase MepM/ murein hydrolase activator NlpD
MPGTRVIVRALGALAVAGALGAPVANASVGGVAAPEPPTVSNAGCEDTATAICPRGARLRISGQNLDTTRAVVFIGTSSPGDDRRTRPTARDDRTLTVVVPTGAHSGPVRLTTSAGQSVAALRRVVIRGRTVPAAKTSPATAGTLLPAGTSFRGGAPTVFRYALPPGTTGGRIELFRTDGPSATLQSWPADIDATGAGQVTWDGELQGASAPAGRYAFRVLGAQPLSASAAGALDGEFDLIDHVFPIRGKHDLGQTATNGFGGGRGHQGQDMFAACGTPLVAAGAGTVAQATYQSRAGNYLVITADDGRSNVYMHMSKPALVRAGDRVRTGQLVGEVGQSGRASGCHLHFELWTAPGWYAGGKPIDALAELTAWDASS